jgi:nickel transport system substrate-binding protein
MKVIRGTSALVVGLLLAACASGSTSSGTTPTTNGTLTIAVQKTVGNLNPFAYKAIFDAQTMIFEPLVEYGPGGKILPALAQSWDTSPDGLKVTFHLRPNVQFSDGSPWNAQVAMLSLHEWVGNAGIASFLGAAGVISTIDTPDDMTLVMHLSQPYTTLLQDLSIVRPVRFLGKNGFDSTGAYTAPIGTGPFKVESNTDTETVFTRNDKYWGTKPRIAKVVLKVIPDAQTRLSAVGSGDVDVIGGDFTAPITPQQASTLKSTSGVHVLTGPGSTTLLITFNYMAGHVTTDTAVRKAISMVVDRNAIVKARLGGFAQTAGGFYPATVPLNDASTAVPSPDIKGAKAILDADGWTGTGVRHKGSASLIATFLVSEEVSPGSQAIAEIVQSELQPLGISLQISNVDHATYHDAVPAGKYDLTLFETIGAPYDPQTTLSNYFVSTLDPSEGRIWMDAQALDPLVNAAVVTAQSPGDRKTAYDNVFRFFRDQTAVLPLAYPERIWASGKRVHDMSLAPTDYDFPVQGVWVS